MSAEYQETADPRYERISNTPTFKGDGLKQWLDAHLVVAGAGSLGQRFTHEASLAGARGTVCDFDTTDTHNLATQEGTVGRFKASALADRCNANGGGRVVGRDIDIRHLGIGEIQKAAVIIDATDNPSLELPLTLISNGLGIPKLRLAVDGTGQAELGRIACGSGGAGFYCVACTYDVADTISAMPRMSCPGQADERGPTNAGGALATAVAGIGLLQAQRLVTGNGIEFVLNQEILVDLSDMRLIPLIGQRSANCISGHVRWSLRRFAGTADDVTFADVFSATRQELGPVEVTLEPFAHPLSIQAHCECGASRDVVGTRWAVAPICTSCHLAMKWVPETQLHRIRDADLHELKIADVPLSQLGLPDRGAMIVARAENLPPIRWVLD